MRLIDADALMYAVDGNSLTTDSLKEYVRSTVKAQPTVDAVPVIRCKDCIWYVVSELKSDGTTDKRYKPTWCKLWREEMCPHDYCSYAKRKDE